jgi:hypothetical protein
MRIRQAAVAAAAGLAMATSFGLAGASVGSAATPALKITQGSKWSAIANGGCFEIVTFALNHTFTGSRGRDKGKWSGGGTTLTMTWTAGKAIGLTFSGTWTTTPGKEYNGTYLYQGSPSNGQIAKQIITGC